jgi:hypothetical protein
MVKMSENKTCESCFYFEKDLGWPYYCTGAPEELNMIFSVNQKACKEYIPAEPEEERIKALLRKLEQEQ